MSGGRPGFVRVATREVRWILRDSAMPLLVLVVPLLAFLLLGATFSDAVVRGLRVDIVDLDGSQTSQRFVQAVDAAPGATVALRSGDLNGAMHAIRSGEAIAAVYLPRDLERDVLAGRRPQVVVFYNKQYFTPGNIAASSVQSALRAAAGELAAPGGKASATPGSLVVEQYVLTNPALNYAQFLLRAVLPTVLHVIVALSAGFAVGSEFRSRGVEDWLAAAGGRPVVALAGKLAPYFAAFVVMMAVEVAIIHGFYGVPFRGDPVMVAAAACLLIAAYLALGSLFQLLARNLAMGLSLTGIVCSPAFGYAGVGFPILGMSLFAQGWGSLLPLRWYIQILFDQAARGIPVAVSALAFAILAGLALAYAALATLRLGAIAGRPLPREAEGVGPPVPARPSVGQAFVAEYGRILRDRGVFGLIVIGPILYGIFYPQPYIGQLIRNIPIALVDDDRSEVGRRLAEALDADEAVTVAVRPATLAEAERALARREVFGIVRIPAGTAAELYKGNGARIPAYVDSAYFLLYNRVVQGISEAAATVSAEMTSRGARSDGSLYRNALASGSPVEILSQPLFNPTGGYGSYVVPAAFVLILQQTLLMGAATVGGVAYERGSGGARAGRGGIAAVPGQALAHLFLALPGVVLYLVVLPRIYGFSTSGRLLDLLAMAVPFILAVSFLGQFVGMLVRRRETAMLLLIAFSLPVFFLVGVAWPQEAIPEVLRRFSVVFPSTFGIDGLVRINQMGATLMDVGGNWARLWILVAVYAALAILAARLTRPSGAER